MKQLETVWRQLLRRRLLPVAILLIAALVAIPVILAKDAEPVAPAAPAPVAGGDEALTATAATGEPIVSLVEEGERTERRRVLGTRKNPFEPGRAPKAPAAKEAASTTQQAPVGGSGGSGAAGGTGTAPPSSTPPATPAPTQPLAPSYELYSLTVRFGDSSADPLEKMNPVRLKALPSAKDPILVYLGVRRDEKTAVFMVDANVEPHGDGSCKPTRANCETIHLRAGDTELFDVTDEDGTVTAQYQLDLLRIKRSTTASAAEAKAARAHVSKAGRKVLRAREASSGPLRYRYDFESGKVHRLDAKAFEALVARTAKATFGLLGVL